MTIPCFLMDFMSITLNHLTEGSFLSTGNTKTVKKSGKVTLLLIVRCYMQMGPAWSFSMVVKRLITHSHKVLVILVTKM